MLKDKIVFITGASSGIGEACAKYFAKAGAKLLLCARRTDVLNTVRDNLIAEYSCDVHTFCLDVCDAQAVKQAITALPSEWQQIDVLINNAGLAAGLETIQDGSITDWDSMIDTNVKGLLYVTKAVANLMIPRNLGHIINIGSIAGHEFYAKGAVYCATKHAVNVITKALRLDLAGNNIRVSTIDPGAVETNFSNIRFKGDSARAKAVYEGFTPLSADDIADAVLYAASCPAHVNISEIIIMPTAQAGISTISRSL